jgi:hypothetical protein
MSLVVPNGQGAQVLAEARNAAHVFRWAGQGTAGTARISYVPLSPQASLEDNLVPPTIAEVVFILKAKTWPPFQQEIAELDVRGVRELGRIQVVDGPGGATALT